MTGTFVVLDGPDGSGKTTQAARLARAIEAAGKRVTLVREPGGTPFGEAIRSVLLGGASRTARAEALAFFAARAELLEKVIEPALASGSVVVSDRFASSTFAYQAAAGDGATELVRALEMIVVRREPDLVILLDVDAAAGLARLGRPLDGIESRGLAFHERVREGFRTYAAERRNAVVVDASRGPDEVAAAVLAAARSRLGAELGLA